MGHEILTGDAWGNGAFQTSAASKEAQNFVTDGGGAEGTAEGRGEAEGATALGRIGSVQAVEDVHSVVVTKNAIPA